MKAGFIIEKVIKGEAIFCGILAAYITAVGEYSELPIEFTALYLNQYVFPLTKSYGANL